MIRKTFIFLIAVLTGCSSSGTKREIHETGIESGTWLVYEGSLPCADCSEVKTRLELFIDHANPDPPFILKQAYIGKKDEDQAVIDHGFYGTVKLTFGENIETVYEMNPYTPNKKIYFLRVNDDTLTVLDQKTKVIKSEHQYHLIRTETIRER